MRVFVFFLFLLLRFDFESVLYKNCTFCGHSPSATWKFVWLVFSTKQLQSVYTQFLVCLKKRMRETKWQASCKINAIPASCCNFDVINSSNEMPQKEITSKTRIREVQNNKKRYGHLTSINEFCFLSENSN